MSVALVDIIGFAKYQTNLDFIEAFSNVFLLPIFVCYIYLFYRRENKRQYMINLKRIMNEIEYMAAGNFDHQIQAQHHNDLDHLATDINNIVLRLNEAISDPKPLIFQRSKCPL